MNNEVFVETVQWAAEILIMVDTVDLGEDFEVLKNGEVVVEGKLTTFSLGLILSEVVRQLSDG
jgi:hypothetical protein